MDSASQELPAGPRKHRTHLGCLRRSFTQGVKQLFRRASQLAHEQSKDIYLAAAAKDRVGKDDRQGEPVGLQGATIVILVLPASASQAPRLNVYGRLRGDDDLKEAHHNLLAVACSKLAVLEVRAEVLVGLCAWEVCGI
jgi:hypothetical protein